MPPQNVKAAKKVIAKKKTINYLKWNRCSAILIIALIKEIYLFYSYS